MVMVAGAVDTTDERRATRTGRGTAGPAPAAAAFLTAVAGGFVEYRATASAWGLLVVAEPLVTVADGLGTWTVNRG